MRNKLKEIGNENRHIFTGEFSRFGVKNGYMGRQKNNIITEYKKRKRRTCNGSFVV